MLRPELQDREVFADGMDNIVSTQKRVARLYFDDGSVEQACPPLRALLQIMLEDTWEGKDLRHPDVRALFTREHLLSSDWYAARLRAKQAVDRRLKKTNYAEEANRLGIAQRLELARRALGETDSNLEKLSGTLGAEPIE